MNIKNIGIALLVLAALFSSGCGADVGLGRPPGAEPTTDIPTQTRGRFISTLPAQELNDGECAIFLWGEQTTRPLVFTQNIQMDWASALIDQRDIKVARTEASEIVIPGFFARQRFQARNVTLDVRLKPEDGRNLYEGIKIPSGIISVRKKDGTENIMSVSGLLGCKIES